jgi:hypothetical protein
MLSMRHSVKFAGAVHLPVPIDEKALGARRRERGNRAEYPGRPPQADRSVLRGSPSWQCPAPSHEPDRDESICVGSIGVQSIGLESVAVQSVRLDSFVVGRARRCAEADC